MRRVGWLLTIVAIVPLFGQDLAPRGRIGEIVAKVEFKDIRYLRRSLSDLGEHKGFALVFLNAECPVSRRFAPKLRALDARYADKGIQFVGVFCSERDTVMEMASFALDQELRFPVVKDEDQAVCAAVGIDRVPTVALLDQEHRLVYRGRLSDQ
jgi:peroxiredoxin